MTNMFKGRINGHKDRSRPRKTYLEEMKIQIVIDI